MEFMNNNNKNNYIIGILGCGKIGQAIVRGYAGSNEEFQPKQVIKFNFKIFHLLFSFLSFYLSLFISIYLSLYISILTIDYCFTKK